jgi:hypothetical protein
MRDEVLLRFVFGSFAAPGALTTTLRWLGEALAFVERRASG